MDNIEYFAKCIYYLENIKKIQYFPYLEIRKMIKRIF